MKSKIVEGVAFELDPSKSYLICIDRSAGVTLDDLHQLVGKAPIGNNSIALMVDGDPNNLVKIIDRPVVVPTPELDAFIATLEGELRVGGGATLDEVYNLAVALREDIQLLATTSDLANNKQ